MKTKGKKNRKKIICSQSVNPSVICLQQCLIWAQPISSLRTFIQDPIKSTRRSWPQPFRNFTELNLRWQQYFRPDRTFKICFQQCIIWPQPISSLHTFIPDTIKSTSRSRQQPFRNFTESNSRSQQYFWPESFTAKRTVENISNHNSFTLTSNLRRSQSVNRKVHVSMQLTTSMQIIQN